MECSRIRLVALDLDGTVLTTAKELTPRTARAIRAVLERGIAVSFVTGRMLPSTAAYAAEAGLVSPLVVLNGSLVTTVAAPEVWGGAVPAGAVARSIELARDHPEATLFWFTRDSFLVEPAGAERFFYLDTWNNGLDARVVPHLADHAVLPVYQLHWVGPRETLDALAAAQDGGSGLVRFRYPSQRGPLEHLEVRRAGTHKGDGLARLRAHLGLAREATLAIGDWHNDTDLLAEAGFAVAMANAVEPVKRAAHLVLERTNDAEGVADYLERTFL